MSMAWTCVLTCEIDQKLNTNSKLFLLLKQNGGPRQQRYVPQTYSNLYLYPRDVSF